LRSFEVMSRVLRMPLVELLLRERVAAVTVLGVITAVSRMVSPKN
jgi:hypothetical protein